jgi:hypothetical protein
LPGRLDWYSAVGLFVINFGVLDYKMFEFLHERLPSGDFQRLREKHFKDRLGAIRECLKTNHYPEAQRAAFDRFTERIDDIRAIRNHIAHGFIYLHWTETEHPPSLMLCNPKDIYAELDPASSRLEFADLANANASLCDLIKDFDQATCLEKQRPR